jgi:hypothetical protein
LNAAREAAIIHENSFLAKMRDGRFEHRLKSGKAERYRVCAIGPGVTRSSATPGNRAPLVP